MDDAPLMLGVSGLRGIVGQSLTPTVATRYAAAFGQWAKQQAETTGQPVRVVLGRDSRPSGQMLEAAVVSGLTAVGCEVIRVGIAATPSIAVMVEHLRADAGMIITASHNPIAWNGIKALRHDGSAPPADQAEAIVAMYRENRDQYGGAERLISTESDESAHQVHLERVLRHVNVAAIRRRRLKVVVDSVCGAGGPISAMLMQELGAELVHLHAEPSGQFPHPPEPLKENLTILAEAVRTHGADVGFAQDPDADRLAIVDETGRYIGEECTLVLAAWHALDQLTDTRDAIIVTNLSTSRMIDDVVARVGGRVVRTPVGEANVAEAVRRHKAVMGGEGNGGVIWPKVIHVRDSIGGAALIMEMLAMREQPLSQIVDQIPKYAMIKRKVNVTPPSAKQLEDVLGRRFSSQTLDVQDGVRVDWPDRWVHVRASNTEPVLRIIAEAGDELTAVKLIEQVQAALNLR